MSAKICVDNLRLAYENHIKQHISKNNKIDLIVDSGSENNISEMDKFIIDTGFNIKNL